MSARKVLVKIGLAAARCGDGRKLRQAAALASEL